MVKGINWMPLVIGSPTNLLKGLSKIYPTFQNKNYLKAVKYRTENLNKFHIKTVHHRILFLPGKNKGSQCFLKNVAVVFNIKYLKGIAMQF